jgi:hypothetical protein
LFKISKLNTIPKPGTNVLPAGTWVDGAVVCVVVSCVVVATGALGVDACGAASCGCASAGGGGSSCGGGGGGAGGALIGLTGFTGLAMLVGFVALLTQVFVVSTQGFTVGWLYGVAQTVICCCDIEPI